ncbi:hypothetical protein D9M71_678530 [compost metagenome]
MGDVQFHVVGVLLHGGGLRSTGVRLFGKGERGETGQGQDDDGFHEITCLLPERRPARTQERGGWFGTLSRGSIRGKWCCGARCNSTEILGSGRCDSYGRMP